MRARCAPLLLLWACLATLQRLEGAPPPPPRLEAREPPAAATAAGDVAVHERVLAKLLRGDMPGVIADAAAALAGGAPDVAPPGAGAPTLHHMLGVALHGAGDVEGAIAAFAASLLSDPRSPGGWSNLGDCFLHTWRVEEAIWAFEMSLLHYGLTDDASKLHKARGWACDWRDREVLAAATRARVSADLAAGREPVASAADFLEVGPAALRAMTARTAARLVEGAAGACAACGRAPARARPLRVGKPTRARV